MDSGLVLEKIKQIIREEFEEDEIDINESTSPLDIDDWDSLANLSLMHRIEEEFGIKFLLGEIQDFKTVGEIVKLVELRISG